MTFCWGKEEATEDEDEEGEDDVDNEDVDDEDEEYQCTLNLLLLTVSTGRIIRNNLIIYYHLFSKVVSRASASVSSN